jgi:RNA polymerase sigma-70 factor (ECF subfamily)
MQESNRARGMDDVRDSIAVWISREILPHEGCVRRWLARRWGSQIDADDVIQETYCRISTLPSVRHIESGRAYFFRTAQSIVIDGARRAKVANGAAMTESEWWSVIDQEPLPDRVVEDREELARVDGLLGKLSWTCRRVIELRRIHGLSQKETARQLGVSENVVENHVTRGLKRVLKAMAEHETAAEPEEANRRAGV